MKNKKIRIFTVLLAVMLCVAAFPLTAFAGGGEETTEPAATPEPTPQPDPIRLTPDGNLTLVDDIQGEQAEDKQFLTVVTKGGNYFYIIIDRAGDMENVYFLNLVDEADLLALIEDMDTAPAPVVTPTQPEPTPEPTPEPEPEQKSGGMGGILIIVLLIAAAGGAFYYFKILKPKQAAQGNTTFDELEFEDEDESAGLISPEVTDSDFDGQEDEE